VNTWHIGPTHILSLAATLDPKKITLRSVRPDHSVA